MCTRHTVLSVVNYVKSHHNDTHKKLIFAAALFGLLLPHLLYNG